MKKEKQFKKFVAIGHWEGNKDTYSVASTAYTINDFKNDLRKNGFVPYVAISEKKLEVLRNIDEYRDLCEEVKKMTVFCYWGTVVDYIDQCFEILERKMNALSVEE